ncbi:CoA transferase [Marinivivus vitaminiproducens]|uniref:CoA transferase n=1 Tax=Marinivivus vitaminiproducens TaxID=3035935 RepID=UPI00279E8DDD|nr:CoA transferase [Geminicoccaceae bacterium SCSIO 64248]
MLLEGVSVVEWSEDLTSQFAARLLADMGATVVKLEPPGGSALRRRGPHWPDGHGALFDFLNSGKICREIDPSAASGAEVLRQAIASADVLVEFGLDAAFATASVTVDELRRSRPELVVLSITPLGLDADPATAPSSDFLLQHRAGLAHAMARPVRDPTAQPPLAAADHEAPLAVGVCGALAAAWGLLAARSGRGPRIDLASQDFYVLLLTDEYTQWHGGERHFSRARGDRPGVAPAGGISWLLPARDGHFMVSPREQHQWERWLDVLGRPAWAQDPAYATVATRKSHWRELLDLMSAWSADQAAEDVAARAQAAGVACFPVSTPSQLLSNAQLLHRDFFDRLTGRDGTAIPVPGLPVRIANTVGEQLARRRILHPPAIDATATPSRSPSNVRA